jgi:membrane-associated PAP2 superfamily phosphatase
MAQYVSHWAIGVADGGPGKCFPAGHASAAFAWFSGYFVFRRASPVVARRWFVTVLVLGTVFGVVQQMRGAHYMSHTLWTAWICWTVAFAIDALVHAARRPAVRVVVREAT